MSKLETLNASLEKSDAKVEKCKATIERHFKQLDKKVKALQKVGYEIDYSKVNFQVKLSSDFKKEVEHINSLKWVDDKSVTEYWELCDLVHKLEDIHNGYKKLKEAEQINDNWKVKIVSEQTKIDFANSAPKVIIDFVNHWGELALEWYMKNSNFPNESNLRRHIENEKQVKIVQLTMSVTSVVGDITDASYLGIGAKGDLTGIIRGTKGSANVETVMAGGWNIQCFHYRTLVHKI